jgi:hypothetical protein
MVSEVLNTPAIWTVGRMFAWPAMTMMEELRNAEAASPSASSPSMRSECPKYRLRTTSVLAILATPHTSSHVRVDWLMPCPWSSPAASAPRNAPASSTP